MILKRVGNVAYELNFPAKLAAVHPVFDISLLKKCVGDLASVLPLESVALKDSLSNVDVLVKIIDLRLEGLQINNLFQPRFCEGVSLQKELLRKQKQP